MTGSAAKPRKPWLTANMVTLARLVVLISGSGTLLQALLEACADPAYGAQVVAVGADRDGIVGLERAAACAVPTFVLPYVKGSDRVAWERARAGARGEETLDAEPFSRRRPRFHGLLTGPFSSLP